MTSLPPAAAGLAGAADALAGDSFEPVDAVREPASAGATQAVPRAAATTHIGTGQQPGPGLDTGSHPDRGPGPGWEPRLPAVRASGAPVELTLDLRGTPPDKMLARLFGALERVSEDVTLVALVRDTPEFASIVAAAYQALRQHGYWSDSSRFPAGTQRMRIARRGPRRGPGTVRGRDADRPAEPSYVPPPPRAIAEQSEDQDSGGSSE